MKFSIKDFFRKCDQIPRILWIWSYILKKSSMENFAFCAVIVKTTASPCDEIKQNEVNVICGNQASCS